MGELIITHVQTPKGPKVHVELASDSDATTGEHEKAHREMVRKLLGGMTDDDLEKNNIVIARKSTNAAREEAGTVAAKDTREKQSVHGYRARRLR